MKDRIIQFLRENNLTSTKFADEIGVQRSSVSHILSGRNKPSFDFIEKMLIAYPELDAQWLITGKGTMNSDQPSLFNQQNNIQINDNLTPLDSNINHKQQESVKIEQTQAQNEIFNTIPINNTKKQIERVMIFYTDGTFKDYKSE